MEKISEEKALQILKSARNITNQKDRKAFDEILKHSRAVEKLSLKIGNNIKKQSYNVDLNFIKTAALLHDIGRFNCPPYSKDSIRHGISGANLLRKNGLKKHALVAERHLGIGISKEEIKKQKLNLPFKDYLPKRIEEKIIAYADNLVSGDKIKEIEYVIYRFMNEIGEYIV